MDEMQKKRIKTLLLMLPMSGFVFLSIAYYLSVSNEWQNDYGISTIFGSNYTLVFWFFAWGVVLLAYLVWKKNRTNDNRNARILPVMVLEATIIFGFISTYMGENFAIIIPFFSLWLCATAITVWKVFQELEK